MRLAYVDVCGFRGYRKPVRIEFAESFTIIDGRNGVGKSTIFDAIEFALTGTLSKYKDAKASGQTVADYIWWTGKGPAPEDRYVDVGFDVGGKVASIRRTQFGEPDQQQLAIVSAQLCDSELAPPAPLEQLCSASIIRDEHIAGLSLDLKETERYALLRDALGANDADDWIAKAHQLLAAAKRRTSAAQEAVNAANSAVSQAARRIDEVRANIVADEVMSEAVRRLRAFADTQASPDRLMGPVRDRIASLNAQADALESLAKRWIEAAHARLRLAELEVAEEQVRSERDAAKAALDNLFAEGVGASPSSALAAEARHLIQLVSLGRTVGLKDGCCPLCAKSQSHAEFDEGIAVAEAIAARLDEAAARQEQREQATKAAEVRLESAERAVATSKAASEKIRSFMQSFDHDRNMLGVADTIGLDELVGRQSEIRSSASAARQDLRILETLRLNSELERAQHAEIEAKALLALEQEKFGRARRAEVNASAIHDAARRAASETLDRRLDRVLPLMSELYRRLRPHPVWRDIEYSIRGDVKRFLKLQVGENLNPQFLFSSGQRRATGLAFLLSVNASLAWSRWRSILLDDPVQHVDDFRTVHLAEVAAQLVAEGRQIVCAVEDAALADLLCRRLPVLRTGQAKRITLGPDSDGALCKLRERDLSPMISRALVTGGSQSRLG
ncbi:AAA family ATPase [Microvirga tunisiensis]|uniref:AAA family ATPase n=1 Tax=Microvirga tunisiensis TaxID=2108360 RepID=A0A5N7MLG4_9HYPH|nr:AAA family ATPase [Microvirga tunisiensis]MPR09749.1 AAA family ATPase [Microvirga tunisiensis]MPR27911.1 AAA family ATPase [Microvirga tunisiensis]